MNDIKQSFSIKDLENLCGVKAHTIRIWEKRYNLLSPDRTQTNIRTYSLQNLQRLLNVTYLVNNGYKISRVSKLTKGEVDEYVKRIVSDSSTRNQAINSFKIAMLNYDLMLFMTTFDQLSEKKTFRQIFTTVFIPLLTEIGLLWQTNTISPSHEHFISNLIKQKLQVNIEKLYSVNPTKLDKVFVLFLPENEIHELGLLYVNYEILLQGYKTIYLGPSISVDNLVGMLAIHENITFVSYFTIKPEKDKVEEYVNNFNEVVCSTKISDFWILGKQVIDYDDAKRFSNHHYFHSMERLIKAL